MTYVPDIQNLVPLAAFFPLFLGLCWFLVFRHTVGVEQHHLFVKVVGIWVGLWLEAAAICMCIYVRKTTWVYLWFLVALSGLVLMSYVITHSDERRQADAQLLPPV